MGISEEEYWDLLPREFIRRERAWLKRQEQEEDAAWSRTIFLVNTVRGLVKGKPIDLETLKERARRRAAGESEMPTKESLQDMWEEIERNRQALTEKAKA